MAFYVDNKGQEWLYAGLTARRYSNYQFTHPISFESRMSLDTGDVGGIFMQIQSVDGNLRYGCGIETIDTPHVKCVRLEHGKVSDIAYAEYKRSTWHTFRFTVVPGEKKIYYYMDGEPVGSLVSEYPDEFSNELYNLYIQGFTYNTGEAVGLIDYVRVGAIEDDPANAESFFWAVGEWESTDATDKSHLTMSIKRDSAGQYTFVLADSSAGFCDGGSGKAEFKAGTFSKTATGTFEFVCDSNGRRGDFEYKFTYNSVSDQFVDAAGIVWSRGK